MGQILSRAGCFVAIILMGYTLRSIGFFKREDFGILSKIVLRITLPCSIIYSFSGKEIDPRLLLLCFLGLLFGVIYVMLGVALTIGKSRKERAFHMVNMSGYNIGNFTMPFAQSFLGPVGVIAVSLFDVGNAVVCLGGAYSVASIVQNGGKFSVKVIGGKLLRSVPFLAYMVMTILALAHIHLPAIVTEFAGIVAGSNSFLAMLMLGVGFHISGDRNQIATIIKILAVRYGIAVVLAFAAYNLLPFGIEYRSAILIAIFGPIASACPAFTGELDGDVGLSSAINSISIVVSLICIVSILLFII